ncbi:MAG: MFS transporter [Verrucomicrobiota bacterium]|nr:MFS transporter [Verrucomicrobiota bacterium]
MSSNTSTAEPLSSGLNFKLSTMMFLQYAVWGAWLPLLWPFLAGHRGFDASQIGAMFAWGAIGAIVAPFIAGQIADRWFNTEKFLAISHIFGGILVWQLASLETYTEFRNFSVLYSLVYSPTLSLTNSLAFHHLPDRDRDFSRVRVWGTIGWIVVGIGIGQWLLHQHTPADVSVEAVAMAQAAGMADAFKVSGALGILMGIFCFFLPSTPPAKSNEKLAIFVAIKEIMKKPLIWLFMKRTEANPEVHRLEIDRNALMALFLIAVPISCIHQFYFVHTAPFLGQFQNQAEGFINIVNKIVGVGGGGLMTIGQMAEIGVLALMPLLAKKFSRKTLLCTGIAAYTLRMFLFAYGPMFPADLQLPAIILGVSMHGFCFGCFIFVAFMVVDEECSADVRASAQSLFNLVIVGIGIIVGSLIAGQVAEAATGYGGTMNYTMLFSIPMVAGFVCLVWMLVFYPHRKPGMAPGNFEFAPVEIEQDSGDDQGDAELASSDEETSAEN